MDGEAPLSRLCMVDQGTAPAVESIETPARFRREGIVVVLCLALATVLAYSNSLRVPLQFDDWNSLEQNPSILTLWPLSVPLTPPAGWGFTVEGRPLLNLSFALNYAAHGLDVRGFHAVNLAIHILAGLTLFGLLRRTLLAPVLRERWGPHASSLAAVGAVFWTLHPLQVESVTYIVQRAESLAGLFFLVVLYAFVRAAGDGGFRIGWGALAVVACLCGMATKEVMSVVPLVVLLYDRTFLGGNFATAWRKRWRWYLCLAATWSLLLYLVLKAGSRGGTFDLSDPLAWGRYGLTQLVAVVRYVRLAVWPQPLIFDYGTFWVQPGAVVPQALAVTLLIVGTAYALVRHPIAGFIGAWFLLTLAPSSVVPGTIQMIVEHRMYLPLAAVAALVLILAAKLPVRARPWLAAGLAAVLGTLTHARNEAYRTEIGLWEDTVAKRPDNARAIGNLGSVLCAAGRFADAQARLESAARLDPTVPEVHYNLGLTYRGQKRLEDSVREFAEAGRLKPKFAQAYFHQATALNELGRRDEAIAAYERAVAVRPRFAEAHCNLGVLLEETGRHDEAIRHYLTALEIRPDYPEAAVNLGVAALRTGQTRLALETLQAALRRAPDLVGAHYNLGLAYAADGNADASLREYAAAVRLDPNHAEARLNLGIAYAQQGQMPAALAELEAAVRLRPDSPEANLNLGIVLGELGRTADAVTRYERALQLRPAYPEAHYNFGNALLRLGRIAEARTHFERALRLNPDFAAARDMLTRIDAALNQPDR